MKKIFIVDDHPIVSQGILRLIEEEEDFEVVGIAEDVSSAIEQIEFKEPDLVTVDLSLKGESGLELVAALRKKHPDLPLLVLTMFEEEDYANKARLNGANGFVMKQLAPDNLIEAIETLLAGELYFSEESMESFSDAVKASDEKAKSPIQKLTNQELKVFHLYGRGKSLQEIGDSLSIGRKTVETYIGRIKEKMEIKNSRELLQKAIQWSSLSDDLL